jgi:hypothetical protein
MLWSPGPLKAFLCRLVTMVRYPTLVGVPMPPEGMYQVTQGLCPNSLLTHLKVFSAPSTAFRIWKTVKLKILNKDNLKVYDLSQSLDSNLYGKAGG